MAAEAMLESPIRSSDIPAIFINGLLFILSKSLSLKLEWVNLNEYYGRTAVVSRSAFLVSPLSKVRGVWPENVTLLCYVAMLALRGLREPGRVGNRGFLEGKGGEKIGRVCGRSNLGSLSTHHFRHAANRAIPLPTSQLIDFWIRLIVRSAANSLLAFHCGWEAARLTGMDVY
jgi:hypothetical protein